MQWISPIKQKLVSDWQSILLIYIFEFVGVVIRKIRKGGGYL